MLWAPTSIFIFLRISRCLGNSFSSTGVRVVCLCPRYIEYLDLKPLIHKYFVPLKSNLSRDLILTIVTFFNGKCLADFFCLSVAQTPILDACTKEEITRMSKEVIGRTTQAGNLKLYNRWEASWLLHGSRLPSFALCGMGPLDQLWLFGTRWLENTNELCRYQQYQLQTFDNNVWHYAYFMYLDIIPWPCRCRLTTFQILVGSTGNSQFLISNYFSTLSHLT